MKKQVILLGAVAAALLGSVAHGGTFITDIQPWDPPSNLQGWSSTNDAGGSPFGTPFGWVGSGNPGGSIQISANTSNNFTPQIDRIFTVGTPFAGGANYTTVDGNPRAMFIQFDYNFNVAPGGLQLYFFSSTVGQTWFYNIQGLSSGGWAGAEVPMYGASFGSWTDLDGGTLTDFQTALTDVDQVGFRLQYVTDTPGQTFAFDNFRRGYSVPEPGTYAALGFALSSLSFTFRRRLNASVDRLKSLLKG